MVSVLLGFLLLKSVLRIRIRYQWTLLNPSLEYGSGSETLYFALPSMGCKAQLIGILYIKCYFFIKAPGSLSIISNKPVWTNEFLWAIVLLGSGSVPVFNFQALIRIKSIRIRNTGLNAVTVLRQIFWHKRTELR